MKWGALNENRSLHSTRNKQMLTDVVRAYIESGEPVSSLAIARLHAEGLSPATIRNVMAELEYAGYLYQPHTSAGRVPTAAAYRFFAQQIGARPLLAKKIASGFAANSMPPPRRKKWPNGRGTCWRRCLADWVSS